jgi:sugar phosphate isomerase/epimerase
MAPTTPYSFQLYSSRNFPPLADQLGVLSSLGYTNVEPFGGLYSDVAALRAGLDAAGLTTRSGHFDLDMLEARFDDAIVVAAALDVEIVVCPYLQPAQRPVDTAGWVALGARLRMLAAKVGTTGRRFAWHNHDFEFVALPDGVLPIEHLLGGDVLWEADLAWVTRAGVDPLPWLKRYSGQTPLIHVKDIAFAGERGDEDGWADVGAGRLPWRELWAAAVAAGAEIMIAEHDNPSDFRRFAANSLRALKSLNQAG